MESLFDDRTLLFIGGTGSLGNAFTEIVFTEAYGTPRRLVIFSRDEAKQYDIRNRLSESNSELIKRTHFRVGDIRDARSLRKVLRLNMDLVINMSALKQIPPYEYLPEEAIKTNVEGVLNLIESIRESQSDVGSVVQISTDKACKPVNVYGMTKALAERIITSANLYSETTDFLCVRYGNVLQSRASMLPYFTRCIEHDMPITLTDPRMSRFLMTLEDSCLLIMRAIAANLRGTIMVPKLDSVRVVDVIDAMRNHYQKPNHPIQVIGIRPGEKIHEVLISEEEIPRTKILSDDYLIVPQFTEVPEEYGNIKKRITFGQTDHLQAIDFGEEYSSSSCLLTSEECASRLHQLGVLEPGTHGDI